MKSSQIGSLVSRTAARMHLTAFAGRLALFTLFASVGYALLLVASKGLGLMPDVFTAWTVAAVPAVAAVLALVLYPRPTRSDAAHAIDKRLGAKDLFLTATLLDSAPGEYKPLVQVDAEQAAASVKPATVVPFTFSRRGGQAVTALIALALATLLPQFDPFNFGEERELEEQRRQQLVETVKTTEARKAALNRVEPAAAQSPEVQHAIDELMRAFQSMKREDQPGNLRRLRDKQMQIGELAKRSQEAKQREQGMRSAMALQQLGGMQNTPMRQAMDKLKQGDASDLTEKIESIQDQMRQLAQEKDPAKQQQLQQQIQQQLQEMKNAAQQAGAQQLADALDRAMQQMQMDQMEGMQGEGLQAAMESMQLSELEAEQLAQMMRDEQALKEAMDALRKAMQANQQEGLDGEACEGCNSLAEYAEMLEKMMGKGGSQMMGEGMGEGEPDGGGGPREEDPNQQMASRDERAPSKLQRGKILAGWKTRELSEKGEARQEYRQALNEVRQEVSAAVQSEDVPPGYRDAIQRYFENLEPEPAPTPSTGGGAAPAPGGSDAPPAGSL